jgi:hypothetical protein
MPSSTLPRRSVILVAPRQGKYIGCGRKPRRNRLVECPIFWWDQVYCFPRSVCRGWKQCLTDEKGSRCLCIVARCACTLLCEQRRAHALILGRNADAGWTAGRNVTKCAPRVCKAHLLRGQTLLLCAIPAFAGNPCFCAQPLLHTAARHEPPSLPSQGRRDAGELRATTPSAM